MADVLPGFTWARDSARYRNTSTGRFVARRDVLSLLDSQINGAERRLGDLVTALYEKRIAPAIFQEQMRTELRRLHLQNRSLSVGGFDRLSNRDYGAVGGRLRDDYQRLTNLASDIVNGRATLPQALNRVQGYAGNARVQFFEGEKSARQQAATEQGMSLLMIRDLGASEHCEDCVNYYLQGYQPDLPPPGTGSSCTTHCRCGLRYREVPTAQVGEFIGTRR